MKKITLLILLFTSLTNGQSFSDFEDGTVHVWTNSDGTTTFLSVEDFPNPEFEHDQKFLQKNCDGSQSALGEMAIVETLTAIDLVICGGVNCFAGYWFTMSNSNNFDITLRVGLKDALGNRVVYPHSELIPANTDWAGYGIGIHDAPNYLDGNGNFDFSQVTEIKFFHNPSDTSYDGLFVNGTLKINDIHPILLLGTDDLNSFSVSLSPNPTHDKIVIKSKNHQMSSYYLYDLFGKQIHKGIINDTQHVIDLNFLTNGMYFIEVTSDQGKEVHKIIKN